jgi:hypothetical protein
MKYSIKLKILLKNFPKRFNKLINLLFFSILIKVIKCQHTFIPIGFDYFKQINDQELLKNINQKQLNELAKYLRNKEKDWWILADQRGWYCKNCKKIIMVSERECYFDTNYCSSCYTESFRSIVY